MVPVRRIVRLTGTDLCPRWRGRIHVVALAASVPAAAALVSRRPTFAVALYAVALVALFATSSGYHGLPLSIRARRMMRQVDHVMIYVFIAACYAPFCWLAVPRQIGLPVLAFAWLGAGAGILMKIRGFDRAGRAGGVLYLVIGCCALLTAPYALRSLDTVEIALLAATGAWYAAGALVLFTRRPDPVPDSFGYHEVWHGAVVLGTACYFLFVWKLVG